MDINIFFHLDDTCLGKRMSYLSATTAMNCFVSRSKQVGVEGRKAITKANLLTEGCWTTDALAY
jgi:hypothetical protein